VPNQSHPGPLEACQASGGRVVPVYQRSNQRLLEAEVVPFPQQLRAKTTIPPRVTRYSQLVLSPRSINRVTFRNETRNPALHHRVEPPSGLNSVELVNGTFRNFGDVVWYSTASW
jgi:hypothetical protein